MSEATAALMGDNGGAGDAAGAADAGTSTDNTGAQSTTPTSWTEGLSPEDQAYIGNKGWENPTDLFQSYRNLEKFAGGSKNLIELPDADADADAMNQFFNKLGRPESPDGYGFQAPEGADEALDGWFRQAAHEEGLTEKQAANLYEKYNQMVGERGEMTAAEMTAKSEQDVVDLQKEWGRDYQKNIDQGQIAVRALGYDEESLQSLESKLGTADMLKLFANIGSKMGEDSFVTGDGSGGFGTSAAQARLEIENLKMDKGFMDQYLSGDKGAVAKYTRLMEKAYG